jgi:anti-anti-sigma regulatory factor
MFRAEIQWLADGPTLKMAGKLVGEWAEEARSLVTTDVVPKGMIVDLTDVSYIDSAGQRLLIWLGSVGAVFAATNVYAAAICERLGLVAVERMPARLSRARKRSPQQRIPVQLDPAVRHQKEEK